MSKRKLVPESRSVPAHGQVPDKEIIRDMVVSCCDAFPNHAVTVLVSERPSSNNPSPRFYYASTADRADLVPMLKAFVANEEENAALSKH